MYGIRGFRLRRWHGPAAVLAVLVIGVGGWLLPRRTSEVVSVDGQHRFDASSAPPRRDIIWQPAEPLPAAPADAGPEVSLVRPQLADGGLSLYYTAQGAEGAANIYRSRFDGRRWLPGEPVAELNSAGDDFGPIISADGEELYLYSDRPGGYGGFDLYVSKRTADGWSAPRNLGPRINTPAHEYDPAISPDGGELFFSSNRTAGMQDRLDAAQASKGNGDAAASIAWKATLRAEPGLRKFDLFVARRETGDAPWQTVRPLAEINTAANEGEPCVSPDGAFLYFTSDRPNPHGAARNYDLYRARRVAGGVLAAENLGSGVNTAANEHDPALSPEGFRIVFSSDRTAQADGNRYSLYLSRAAEVYDERAWDVSHVPPLGDLLWWLVLALLAAALLAALAWYLREVSLRRAPVPGFFLMALLLHLLLAGVTFFVPVDGMTLAERITRQFEKIVARDVQLDSSERSQRASERAYEKVADLQSIETVQVADAPRSISSTPNMAIPTQASAPNIPRQVDRQSLPERVALEPVEIVPNHQQNRQMDRRRSVVEELLAEDLVRIEEVQSPAERPSPESVAKADVQISRTQQAEAPANSPLERRPVDIVHPLSQEAVVSQRLETAEPSPRRQPIVPPVERVARADVATAENFMIDTDPAVPSPNAGGSPQPDTVKPEIPRAASTSDLSSPAPLAEMKVAPRFAPAGAVEAAAHSAATPSTANRAASSSLARQDRLALLDTPAPLQIVTEAADRAANEPGIVLSSPDVKIEIARATPGGPMLEPAAPSGMASGGPVSSAVQQEFVAVERPAAPPRASAGTGPAAETVRRPSPAALEIASVETIPAGEPAPAVSADAANILRGEMVEATRQSDAAGPALSDRRFDVAGSTPKPPASLAPPNIRAALEEALAPRGASQQFAEIARVDAAALADVGAAEMTIATDSAAIAADSAEDSPMAVEGVEVDFARAAGPETMSVDVPSHRAVGGPYSNRRSDLAVGALAKVEVDADVSFSPAAAQIQRYTAPAPLALYAHDKIGLQAMLRLRVGDNQTKQDLIESFGGKKETLVAIQRGLAWLAGVQHDDGHWDLQDFAGAKKSGGHGSSKSNTAATGLGLLPFLGDGHTHQGGQYQEIVEKGLRWLIDNQKDDGDLFTGGEGNAHMYSHGIAAIALCEAYGMTQDEALRGPAQRSIDFIVKSQHGEGGWRYRPGEAGDTSVVGWQVMALKSAQMAGLDVPEATLNRTRRFIDAVRSGKDGGEYAYQRGGPRPLAMTAEGLLCYAYLGAKRDDPFLLRGVETVAAHVPAKGKDNSYYWYYATQALFHVQGQPWKQWNEAMSSTLLSSQIASGPAAGSWDPTDQWEERGGRIMSTSLRLLMLEVYFRHLPLYQALE